MDPGPRPLPFGPQLEEMVDAFVRMAPGDFDGVGARGEDPETRLPAFDERAESAGRLQHVEGIGREDLGELEHLGLLEHHPHRHPGGIDVGGLEAEDVPVRPLAADHEVAMMLRIPPHVIRVMRGLDPAAAGPTELEFDLGRFAQDLRQRRLQREAFRPVDAGRPQRPSLHVGRLPPFIEGARDFDEVGGRIRTERLPEKEMDAAALQPMART